MTMTSSRSQAKSTIEPQKEAGADLTHVYTLIHCFLKERAHTKAASALKKAADGIVTIDDAAVHDGPTLQKILEEWKELKAAAGAMDTSSSDSSSDSSDESSSEDDSETENGGTGKSKSKPSDSSDDSSDDNGANRQKVTQRVVNLRESQRDSSKTLSSEDVTGSDEESTDEGPDSSVDSDVDMDSSSVPTATEGSKRKALQVKKPATSSSDSTSGSSSDSSSSEDDQVTRKTKRKASPDTTSSSESSDSDSDEDSEPPTAKKSTRKAASSSSSSDSSSESDKSESSSSSSSESEDELAETPVPSVRPDPDARATKKLRANEGGTAVVTATVIAKKQAGDGRGGKASRTTNTPFQRVNAQAVKYFDDKLKDNTFESRGARGDDYGAKANRDLIVTRGDGFRKEKNKKKRGSYRGGDITLHSHSFKFED